MGPLDFHGWLGRGETASPNSVHLVTFKKKNSDDADMDIFDSDFKTTVDENWFLDPKTRPIPSMYGIFNYIYHKNQPFM